MARARITDRLSSAAQQAMLACFRSRMPAALIVLRIKAETGEVVAERTIARRKSEWDAEQRRRQAGREQMQDLLEAMRAGDHSPAEMVNALAMEALMRDPESFASLNPIDVQRTSVAAEKVRLQREALDLKKRQLALDERKFEAMQERERKAIETAEALENKVRGGGSITEEDLQKIRAVYGIEKKP